MVILRVCVGTSCHLKGSYNVVQSFQQLIEQENLHDQVDLQVAFCMQKCQMGVCVSVNDEIYSVTPATARAFFRETIMPAAAK